MPGEEGIEIDSEKEEPSKEDFFSEKAGELILDISDSIDPIFMADYLREYGLYRIVILGGEKEKATNKALAIVEDLAKLFPHTKSLSFVELESSREKYIFGIYVNS